MPLQFNAKTILPSNRLKKSGKGRMLKLAAILGSAACLMATPAHADVVSDWSELQTAVDKDSRDPMADFDPKTFQAFSRMSLAMFEAANSVDPKYQSWLKIPRAPSGGSDAAAAASAAHDVLVSLYPSAKEKLDKALAMHLMDIPAGAERDKGVAAGKVAAAAALAAGGMDPAIPKGSYRPTAPAGKWSASGVPFPPEITTFRPWFMSSASQYRLPPPPALSSKAYTDSFNETKEMGAKNSKVRSAEQTINARFFIDYQLDPMMRQIASMPGRSIVRNARFYALMGMAGDDESMILADGKMAHMYWRPLNAIRTADADGNDATMMDAEWEPLIRTPGQPEYPCGHCSLSMTVATIAAAEGPPPPGGYRFVSDSLGGLSRNFPTLGDYAIAASDSRIQAGVHWRMTNDATRVASEQFAKMVLAKFAPPLK